MRMSVTLSADVLLAVDRIAGKRGRSAIVEMALRSFVDQRARAARNTQDLAIINRHAEALNAEAKVFLAFQTS